MNKLIAPSTDFRAVRDGRNSQVFYVDVALDTARYAAAGTGLVLPISGNSFYCDANPSDGNAFVHFQDTNFDRGPVPLYVSPGVIFNIPYTKVLIENSAQPGKKIRIAYGIDVDFQPGSVAQIAVTNNGGFTNIRAEAATGNYKSISALSANVPDTIFTPAANIKGALILSAGWENQLATTTYGITTILAKNSAPTTVIDGEVYATTNFGVSFGAGAMETGQLNQVQYVSPGLGLYIISTFASAAAPVRHCRYKFL